MEYLKKLKALTYCMGLKYWWNIDADLDKTQRSSTFEAAIKTLFPLTAEDCLPVMNYTGMPAVLLHSQLL